MHLHASTTGKTLSQPFIIHTYKSMPTEQWFLIIFYQIEYNLNKNYIRIK